MSCLCPIDAWRAAKCNESGKRGITFRIQDAYTDQPIQVPCGKCLGCAADRARIWSVRMHHEASQHEQNCFVTLTYGDPAPSHINKRDVQLFFKRLRRLHSVRYFCTGEYGGHTHRPHYHAVIFGRDFLEGSYAINDTLYDNRSLNDAWGLGFTSIGRVSIASCMYVAGYCQKKLGDQDTFSLMSRRPGIGHTWLDAYRDDIINTGKVVIEGKEFPVPKRYLDWYEAEFEALKLERKQFFSTMTAEQRWLRRVDVRAKEAMYKSRLELRQETI